MAQPFTYIRFFQDIYLEDILLVRGKNASLGEMYRALAPKGVPVPNGFVVTAEAYRYVLESAAAWGKPHAALDGLDAKCVRSRTTCCRSMPLPSCSTVFRSVPTT